MGLRCGIVGLPNVGKSTLFNALTGMQIEAANYPFCTIDPNSGMVPIADSDLEQIAKLANAKKIVPNTVELVDVAGLIKDASKNAGLGNQFLGHIRATDAVVQVIRCFDDDDVVHVNDKIAPIDDWEIINLELVLADLSILEKAISTRSRKAATGDKLLREQLETFELCREHLAAGKMLRTLSLTQKQLMQIDEFQLITAMPMLALANVSEEQLLADDEMIVSLRQMVEAEGCQLLKVCAKFEEQMNSLEPAERQEWLTEYGLSGSGLGQFVKAAFSLLDLQVFYTAGIKEARAWTITKGSLAPVAAGVIHTDFMKSFIRVEIIGLQDYLQYDGYAGAKQAGKLRVEGRDYIMQDKDVALFRTGL